MDRRTLLLCLAASALAACGEDEPDGPPRGGEAPSAAEMARAVELENRGIALLERYDYGDAVAPLEEAARIAPGWTTAKLHLAIGLLHTQGEGVPRARSLLDEVLGKEPGNPRALFLSAWLAERDGESERALELYRRAYAATGEDPIVGAKLGLLLANSEGREEEALRLLGEVHARRPALVSPVNQLMLLHRQLGNAEESERYLALLLALKGTVRPDIEANKVGEELRDAYGNMGRWSAAERGFADPGTGASRPDGSVTAQVREIAGFRPGALPEGAPVAWLGVAAFDFDADGDVDLFVPGGDGPSALLRNDGRFGFTDVAAASGADLAGVYAAAVGGFHVDTSPGTAASPGLRAHPDLVLARTDGLVLLRNRGDGTFEDATEAAGLGADPGGARALLVVDADQEGDLDLFVAGAEGGRNRLFANRGAGRFEEVAEAAGLAGDGGAYGPAVVVDVEGDCDLDLLVTRPSGPPVLYLNDRLLRFHAAEAGIPDGVRGEAGALSADFDGDGREDVLLLSAGSATLLRGTGTAAGFEAALVDTAPGGPAVAVDPRLSGLLDLVFATGERLPGVERGPFGPAAALHAGAPRANLLAADLDGAGAEEIVLVAPGEPVRIVVLAAEERGNALVLEFQGVIRNDVQAGWSNLEGRGALVEVKSGPFFQMRRVAQTQGFGAAAPTRMVAGVGRAADADFVRVLWPDCVQQAVLDVPVGAPQLVVEEQRRPDSCPLLFAWDGERFAFVTDFLGAGGVGFLVAPGVYGAPDPTESVKVPAELVEPRDGELLFKLHEAMEEVCYVDRVELEAVDHPRDVRVFPDERFSGEPPFADGRLLAHREELLPVAARDQGGRDVLDRVLVSDRRYPDSARLHPRLLGATDEQILELDFGDRLRGVAPGDPLVLHLDGWIEYGYTRTSVAAAGEGFEYLLPTLETWDEPTGAWRTLVANLGYPAGFPRVMTYDVTGIVSRETPRLRIRTNFEIYWDRVWLAPSLPLEGLVRRHLAAPARAELRWVGYPREYSPDGRMPRIYDYQTMDPAMPWKTVEGDFTRFGDVRPLLLEADDMYVVYGKGEEIEVAFDVAALPKVPEGSTRSYVLRFVGWCKGQELYTAHGFTVEPLPFLGMSHYPYPESERYPDDEAHRRYREEWNTRRVRAPVR